MERYYLAGEGADMRAADEASMPGPDSLKVRTWRGYKGCRECAC